LCATVNPSSERGVASGGLQKLLPALCYRIKILNPLGFNERIIQVIVDQRSDDF